VGVTTGVEHDAIVSAIRRLERVHQFALHVALEVVQVLIGEALAQFVKEINERAMTINAGFPLA
jgi:hypothetical protein